MPKPKIPSKIKMLKGTYRKDRAPKNEMEFPASAIMPPPPKEFSKEAKAEWYLITEALSKLEMLNDVDLKILESYCYNVGLMREAMRELEKNGKISMMVNKGGGKYPIVSPWLKIYNEANTNILKIADRFGFTPSARTKISVPETKKDIDPFEALLKKNK